MALMASLFMSDTVPQRALSSSIKLASSGSTGGGTVALTVAMADPDEPLPAPGCPVGDVVQLGTEEQDATCFPAFMPLSVPACPLLT
jgi:hypothetical protein